MTQGDTLCLCLKVAIAFPLEYWEFYSEVIKSSPVEVEVGETLLAGGQFEVSPRFSCLLENSSSV